MNANGPSSASRAIVAFTILAAFLIVAGLVGAMRHYTRPAPVNQARADERKKNLAELRNADSQVLNQYAWQDQTKQIVRIPISNALELILKEYQNPALGRSNLAARGDKLFPPPPPPVNYE